MAGDSNRMRDQGQVLIHSNFVTDSRDWGIIADAGMRDQEPLVPSKFLQSHPGPVRNLRELNNEQSILTQFAGSLNTQVVGFIPYSEKIKECSGKGVTLFQLYPDSLECDAFRNLAENIWKNELYSVPTSMKFEDLHAWWMGAKEA